MSIARLQDLVKMTLTTGGSDNRVVNSALATGYQALGANQDGKTIPGKFTEGSSWEVGEYVYTHSTTTLARARLIASSTSSAVTFTSAAIFTSTWTSRDAERANPPANWYYLQDYASSVRQLTGATDVTSEFQSLVTAMQTAARAQGGGEFVCDLSDAVLLLSGALQDTGNLNAQILLPVMRNGYDASPDPHAEFAFISNNRKNLDYSVFNGATPSFPGRPATTGGRIISSITGTGTLPSVLACGMASGATSPFARTGLHFENIEIFTAGYANANASPTTKMTAINAAYAVTMIGKNLFVVGGPMKAWYYTALPTGPCYGIRWPTNNNDVQVYSENCTAIGFETGHLIAEHHDGALQSVFCKWGLEIPALYHAYFLNKMEMAYCPYGIKGSGGASYGRIMQADSEVALSGDTNNAVFLRVYDIDDASNFLHGDVSHYHIVQGAVGVRTTGATATSKNGGTNFSVTRSA